MKNFIGILLIVLSLTGNKAHSQSVINAGFEHLNSDGSLSNWGNVYSFPVWIDSLGMSHSDSVVFDNALYAPGSDANSGSTALELRNAWNFTSNTGIAGAVASDDDSVFSSWGLQNLVPTNATTLNPFSALDFGFYYKFFPVNGDSAVAEIALWDSIGNQLAQGLLIITDPANTYTLAYTSINYSAAGFAAYYSFSISTFYSVSPGSHEPAFGTRLLVDDIGFNHAATSGLNTISRNSTIKIYPNPAVDKLQIDTQVFGDYSYSISTMHGQLLLEGMLQGNSETIALGSFESGIYILEINNGETNEQRRFIVRK